MRNILTLPWTNYADKITKIVVEDGIHDLGQMAFCELPNLTDVTLNENVTIGRFAFSKTGVQP